MVTSIQYGTADIFITSLAPVEVRKLIDEAATGDGWVELPSVKDGAKPRWLRVTNTIPFIIREATTRGTR